MNPMALNTSIANERLRVGFVGAGKIAYAICAGLINSGYLKPYQIYASAPSNNNIIAFKKLGCHITNDNAHLFLTADGETEPPPVDSDGHSLVMLFICVKPHIPLKLPGFWDFLTKACFINSLGNSSLVVVSTLAGIPLSTLKLSIDSHFKSSVPYIIHLARILPNTACAVNTGVIGLTLSESANVVSNELITLLRQLGYPHVVSEDQLDAVVGVAGSGIAYVYSLIQAMADGGVLVGLPRQTAVKLAAQTVAGAAEMVLRTDQGPIELRNDVCSPGGTTIAGVQQLEQGSFNSTVINAVETATKKSREFSKVFNNK